MGGVSVLNNKMENITFIWDAHNHCWIHDDIEDTSIFIHKYPPTKYLVSIQHLKYIGISKHDVFDSIYSAQTFIELKYNGLVKYRDMPEEETRR